MRVTVRAKEAGTIRDLEDRQDLGLASEDDAQAIKEYFGNRPAVQEFDGFFVKVEDGDYSEVYGYHGIVPGLSKTIWRITQTFSASRPKGIAAKKRSARRLPSGSGMQGLR